MVKRQDQVLETQGQGGNPSCRKHLGSKASRFGASPRPGQARGRQRSGGHGSFIASSP
jgi:hypothetical protein